MELGAVCDGSATGFACQWAALAGRQPAGRGKWFLLHDTRLDVLRGSVLCKEIGHSPGPAVQSLRPAERNNDGKNSSSLRCDHGSLGVTGGAAMRPLVIGE